MSFAVAEEKSASKDNGQETQAISAGQSKKLLRDAVSPDAQTKKINYVAWSKLLGSFIIFFNIWGIVLAFGAFQTYYEQALLKQNSSSSIAWIGTSAAFLLLFGGTITGKLYDLGHSRVLLIAGSLLVVFGLMMTSLSGRFYEVFLSQGIVVGLGTSMLYIPAVTIVALAFEGRKRAIALGLANAGSSIGGVVYPIMFRRLQPQIGFPWAVRVIAFLMLGTFAISLVILLPLELNKSSKVRNLLDKSALTDLPLMLYVLSGIFSGIGYYTPLIAFYALAIANGASSISRIGAGFIALRLGPLFTYTLALLFSSILLLAWIAVKSLAGLIIWTVMLGIVTGVIISLPGAVVPQLCPDLNFLGARLGMYFLGVAVGILIGGPIGGKLIDAISPTKTVWWPLQVFTGLTMLVAFALNIYPCLHVHRKQRE